MGNLPSWKSVRSHFETLQGRPAGFEELVRSFGLGLESEAGFKKQLKDLVTTGRLRKVKGRKYVIMPEPAPKKEELKPIVPQKPVPEITTPFPKKERDLSQKKVKESSVNSDDNEGHQPAKEIYPENRESRNRNVRAQIIREGRFFIAVCEERGKKIRYVLPLRAVANNQVGQTVLIKPSFKRGPMGLRTAEIVQGAVRVVGFGDVVESFRKEWNLPQSFPRLVFEEVDQFPAPTFTAQFGRVDLRSLHVITIDPRDAKDHDDAISLEDQGENGWRLGVHIADVAEYVTQDSETDEEALRRSFTQYLPWIAYPMLPQRLSGDLCSLLEGQERLALTCFMNVDRQGNLLSYNFQESFIRVARFYSYEEAQGAREAGDPFLINLDLVARTFREKRKAEGFLDFDLPEPKFETDADRVPIDSYPLQRLPSHFWIEECMLLANQACAKFLHKHKLPGLYRVHEQPDLEVIEELMLTGALGPQEFLPETAVLRKSKGYLNPAVMQLFSRLLGRGGEALPPPVQRRVLQSMKKAQYDPRPLGHFALGWEYYAHFTSPIRRYADLWTHRMMKGFLRGETQKRDTKLRAVAVGTQVSERELDVMKIERRSHRIAVAWILRGREGQEFDGQISGLESHGMYVLVQRPFGEGMIPLFRLKDDFYEKDPQSGALIGRRSRKKFELGQKVRVRLLKADPIKGHVDFDLVEMRA